MAKQIGEAVRVKAFNCGALDAYTACSFGGDPPLNFNLTSIGEAQKAPAKSVVILGGYTNDKEAEKLATAWMIVIALLSPDFRNVEDLIAALWRDARAQGNGVQRVGQVEYSLQYKNEVTILAANAL
jgi:hypothetical protein